MKNIKYFVFLLSLSLMISCGQDDVESITNLGTLTSTSEISVGFIDTNDNQLVLESGGAVSFTIGLSVNPLDVDTEVTLGITSSDGTIDGAGFPASVTIPAGATTAQVDVTFSDDGVSEGAIPETFTLEILDADFGGSTVFYLTAANLNRTINVADELPFMVTTTPADVDFNFTWTGTHDLDCRILDAGLATISTGYSVTPGETVTLDQTDADGVYTLTIRPWSVTSASTDYTFEFVYPTGSEMFTGTQALGPGFWAEEFTILEITKATNAGGTEVTYTIIEL